MNAVADYPDLPWHMEPVPAEIPNGEFLLVQTSGGGIEIGLLTPRHCYIAGVAHRRDLDPRIHTFAVAWCLLAEINSAMKNGRIDGINDGGVKG